MAEPIRVETTSAADAVDLSRTLAAHGITGVPVGADGRWQVEVSSAREETRRLLADVLTALATWLEDRRLPEIPLRVGERAYTFKPPPGEAKPGAGRGRPRERGLARRAPVSGAVRGPEAESAWDERPPASSARSGARVPTAP